jgi:hypothetical protein
MLNPPDLSELRRANPISLEEARRLAEALDLDSRIHGLRAEPGREPEGGARRRVLVAVLTGSLLLAAIIAATPAWGLVRDVLPFWDQPSAPQSVQVQFSSLNLGAPRGMSPQARGGDTREVGRFTFGGATRTLWVAPAKNGGFCSLWLPSGGGGCSTSGQPLSTGALLRGGFPEWINGDAMSPAVNDVVIRFGDGSAVHPRIVWVSAPINAGFFAYDVPDGKYVTGVDAYGRDGVLVRHEIFR